MMGIIVGKESSKLRCDAFECRIESQEVSGADNGQDDVRRVMRNHGWQCCANGKDYCPDHAYSSWKPETELLRTRADMILVARCLKIDLDHITRGMVIPDVKGTLAVNMRVMADALDEERNGRTDFVGGVTPSQAIQETFGEIG